MEVIDQIENLSRDRLARSVIENFAKIFVDHLVQTGL